MVVWQSRHRNHSVAYRRALSRPFRVARTLIFALTLAFLSNDMATAGEQMPPNPRNQPKALTPEEIERLFGPNTAAAESLSETGSYGFAIRRLNHMLGTHLRQGFGGQAHLRQGFGGKAHGDWGERDHPPSPMQRQAGPSDGRTEGSGE